MTDPVLCDRSGNISGDHYAISFSARLSKPRTNRAIVKFRKLRAIDTTTFKECICQDKNLCDIEAPLHDLITNYNRSLNDIINSQAPLLNRTITLRPHAPWYTDTLRDAKRRQLERRWRSTKLEVNHQIYRDFCVVVNKSLRAAKSEYYEKQIKQSRLDTKAMFRTVNTLMGNNRGCPLPMHTSDAQLTGDFSDFFTAKLSMIRDSLCPEDTSYLTTPSDDGVQVTLDTFVPTTNEEIIGIIKSSPDKSCKLDPIPTWPLKSCAHELVPLIVAIVNRSFETSEVPAELKHAHIKPRLKKPSLDPELLSNYRAVSNQPFISKIMEKVVNTRIEQRLLENNLHDPLQSAYRKQHSTETALIKIQHDIVQALDSGRVAALILLDLSAAFDTVDHAILLERLKETHGISGDALLWMASYLCQRCQQVNIGEDASFDVTLGYGVPQGSVLGPKLFFLYTRPLGNIIRHHKLDVHFYADDTQLYVSSMNSDHEERIAVVEWLHQRRSYLADEKYAQGQWRGDGSDLVHIQART